MKLKISRQQMQVGEIFYNELKLPRMKMTLVRDHSRRLTLSLDKKKGKMTLPKKKKREILRGKRLDLKKQMPQNFQMPQKLQQSENYYLIKLKLIWKLKTLKIRQK